MNYGMFFRNKMRCFRGEELNLLQQHQTTAAEKLFVFRGNYIQGVMFCFCENQTLLMVVS